MYKKIYNYYKRHSTPTTDYNPLERCKRINSIITHLRELYGKDKVHLSEIMSTGFGDMGEAPFSIVINVGDFKISNGTVEHTIRGVYVIIPFSKYGKNGLLHAGFGLHRRTFSDEEIRERYAHSHVHKLTIAHNSAYSGGYLPHSNVIKRFCIGDNPISNALAYLSDNPTKVTAFLFKKQLQETLEWENSHDSYIRIRELNPQEYVKFEIKEYNNLSDYTNYNAFANNEVKETIKHLKNYLDLFLKLGYVDIHLDGGKIKLDVDLKAVSIFLTKSGYAKYLSKQGWLASYNLYLGYYFLKGDSDYYYQLTNDVNREEYIEELIESNCLTYEDDNHWDIEMPDVRIVKESEREGNVPKIFTINPRLISSLFSKLEELINRNLELKLKNRLNGIKRESVSID